MKKSVLAMAIAIGMLLPSIGFAKTGPALINGALSYERSDDEFASAIIVDVGSGKTLYEYRAERKWSAASITKLMGALVFLDHRPSWSRVVSIAKSDQIGGGSLRVSPGATMTVKDLLYSSITASANNAAVALARVTGMGARSFVAAMNKKAKELGMEKSHFTDPSGLDPGNVVTARDLVKLATTAFNTDSIQRAATTASYTFNVRNPKMVKTIKSTDDLLILPAHDDVIVTGGKTGFIYESRYNLVVRLHPAVDTDVSRELLVIVLGSPARSASFTSAKSLANWAWNAHRWE